MKNFKPALFFVGKFLLIYLLGNTLYGLYVHAYDQKADPVTASVSFQLCDVLAVAGENVEGVYNPLAPTILIKEGGNIVLSVFEGCNGINVMIVFGAFIFAFGGPWKHFAWYLPVGLLAIHGFNLLRLYLLFETAKYRPQYFYYFHKYFFTAVIYLVVFALWLLWIKLNAARAPAKTA